MGHKCYKCGKILSSQQALAYHSTSRSCVSSSNDDDSQLEKLISSSITHIICNEACVIISIKGTVRDVEYIGHPIYDFLNTMRHKYCFARKHIDVLLQSDDSICNFFVNDITGKRLKTLRTVLYKGEDKKMHVFQFKQEAGDLHMINDMAESTETRSCPMKYASRLRFRSG